MNALSQAMNAILSAELSPATERTAIRLLAKASTTGGQYNCTWADFLTLCGCDNRNAGRRHLTHIAKKGIIHYSTNEYVYVTFLAWMPAPDAPHMARGRAETEVGDHQNGACARQNGDGDDAERRVGALELQRVGAPNPPPIPPLSWVELSNDLDPDPDQVILNPTQPPTPTDVAEWVVALLTDPAIDLQPDNAKDIARLHKPTYVVKHVATWWEKRTELSPGVLVYRLLKSRRQCRPNPHPSDGFLESEFWREHYNLAPDEIVEALPAPINPREGWWEIPT